MKRKDINTLLGTMLIPLAFFILNYIILGVPINFFEMLMLIIISIFSVYFYSQKKDYLNPAIYFPILYFLIYWLGDFDFGLYPNVPTILWEYYLLGLIGFYLGAMAIDKLKIDPSKPVEKDYLSKNAILIFAFIYAIVLLTKFVIYLKSGIPLLASNIDATRQSISEDYGPLKVIATAYTILPVFFFYDIVSRKKNGLRVPKIDIIIIATSFFLAMLDVSRLLIIQMIIPMLFIYVLKVKRFKLKTIVLSAIVMILFIGGNKLVRNILDNPGYLASIQATRNTNMLENIFLSAFNSFRVGIDDFRQLVNVVPLSSSYTYGQMFLNSILSPLPGKQIVMGYYVAQLLGMNFDGIGAATTILGMFYLDGGPMMIFVGMFLFALFAMYYYKKYIKYSTVSIYSLFAVYILYYVINTVRTNVMPTIEPLLVILYYIVFGLIARKATQKDEK